MSRFSLAMVFVLFFAGCSSSKKNETNNTESLRPDEGNHRLAINVNVDGDLIEWPQPLPGYSKETTLHFGVTNNKQFLFIAVSCDDERMQRKMLQTGMELYFSENGKKETTTGVEFPLPGIREVHNTGTAEQVKTPEQEAKDFNNRRSAGLTNFQTFGLKRTTDGVYPVTAGNGIKINYSWSSNNFFNIEYAIPLIELPPVTTAGINRDIRVGIKLNGFGSRENNRQGNTYAGSTRNGGMRGGGMGGGMRGGGMRGGGMRQNGQGNNGANNMSEALKDQSFWTKYTIS